MNKLSNYNYEVSIDETTNVFYNSISDKILILNKDESLKVNYLLNNLQEFERDFPSIFQAFCAWHFIIDKKINEIDFIKENYLKTILNNSTLDLTINPTLDCNFNCWYCFVTENISQKKGTKMSNNVKEKILRLIEKKVKSREINVLNLGWFGGEPLLFYDEIFYEITNNAKQICEKYGCAYSNSIISNGYLLDNNKIKYMKSINMISMQITIDGCERKHNKIRNENGKNSYKKIISNIIVASNILEKTQLLIRINYDKTTLNNVEEIINDLNSVNKKNVLIDLQKVWQVSDSESLSIQFEEARNKFVSAGFNTRIWAFKPSRYFSCVFDKNNSFAINYDGNIFKCVSRDYTTPLASISDDGDILFNDHANDYSARNVFDIQTCVKCKELPMCFGPCLQKIVENTNLEDACVLKLSETKVEDYIKIRAYDVIKKI